MSFMCAPNSPLLLSLLATLAPVYGQFMGYPYDYSSMFQGYTGYSPMGSMGFGAFGTGMESLYGGAQMYNAYNPYGNGLFSFANNGMFGQNAFGTAFNTNNNNQNNLFGMSTNGLGMMSATSQPQQNFGSFQNFQQQTTSLQPVNDGNTMKAFGRRTQNFNNNYAPTRVGQGWNQKV